MIMIKIKTENIKYGWECEAINTLITLLLEMYIIQLLLKILAIFYKDKHPPNLWPYNSSVRYFIKKNSTTFLQKVMCKNVNSNSICYTQSVKKIIIYQYRIMDKQIIIHNRILLNNSKKMNYKYKITAWTNIRSIALQCQ